MVTSDTGSRGPSLARDELRLLHVEDNAMDHMLVLEHIRMAGYDVTARRVDTIADVRAALQEAEWDILIADYALCGFTALEVIAELKTLAPTLPCLVVSGMADDETAVTCMKAGASDFLRKDACSRLATVIARTLREARERRERDMEREAAARDLAEKNARLEQALVQLKEAQTRLIQQERLTALGRMASGIAHDFNNMLMPILGLTEILLTDSSKWENRSEVAGMLLAVNTAARDASKVVKRLREFYRPHDELSTERIDVAALFSEVASVTNPAFRIDSAPAASISFHQDVPGNLGITGNHSQLREALVNLVLNSVDAMPDGGSITLAAREEKDAWLIGVNDTGLGMPPHVLAHCIEPFYSTKGERGTGMGLAMVHGIAERHGGHLDIQSKVGRGTSIFLRLPRLEPTASGVEGAEPLPSAVRTRNLSILVVDDEERTRRLLKRLLQYASHEVRVAEDMVTGLAAFESGHFDLVITDLAMPGGTGDQLAIELRKRNSGIPIILLTGLGDFIQPTATLPEGIDLLLSKPVGNAELLAGIEAALKASKGR